MFLMIDFLLHASFILCFLVFTMGFSYVFRSPPAGTQDLIFQLPGGISEKLIHLEIRKQYLSVLNARIIGQVN